MIPARHTRFHTAFFRFYSKYLMKNNFRSVAFVDDPGPTGKALLIIGNHFSWYDGFFMNYYNDRVLKKIFHVMMLEEQLKGRMFLNKTGAFSIKPGSRDIMESLRYSSQILANPDNMLLMYPTGEIQSSYISSFSFMKGLDRILEGNDPEIRFYACLIDYFSGRKPAAWIYFHTPPDEYRDTPGLEKAYNEFYRACIPRQNAYRR
ncbi:MAG: 1-acyl-sn-glycerol-3-phosphate acyltransferase [Bacteroidales bacterium]|jgi:1-acyl-sn-glycerol-3-phosphate acyltransferase|nr:1-acyl-sn-glycerol-3-phosphate acyltransferase [Bacteroidales bacterium]